MNFRASLCALSLSPLVLASMAAAAELKQETLQSFDEHIAVVNSQMQQRIRGGAAFLWIDESPERIMQAREGKIVVAPAAAHTPKRVPSGLIHHWIGAAFLANATVEDVFSVVRDYQHYKDYYRPVVIDSKSVQQSGAEDQFSMLLMNKSWLTQTALDSDYHSSYVQVDTSRWYSVSYTTRVQEIADYGQPDEHKLPADGGSGYVWRLHSITRFEERDGGVYVEIEASALSRDIPGSLRWLVDPIVRSVSRHSLLTSLRQTQDAVSISSTVARRTAKPSADPVLAPVVRSFR
jgi:hypothetical protein